MIFSEPLPFSDAVRILLEKKLLPNDLTSAELREIDEAIRRRAIFSARTTKLAHLEEIVRVTRDLLDGKINEATGRMLLQDSLDRLQYDPTVGFDDSLAEPAEPGSLRDLRSDKRTALILDTQTRLAANEAYRIAGQTDFALYAWPCYELIRIYPRRVPRGKKELKRGLVDDPGKDWPSRWQRSGGQFYGNGRMIARKDDPIWTLLGASQFFDDGLDSEVPPFAFNSGYGWREVRRDECVALGVITREDVAAKPEGASLATKTATALQKQAERFTEPELSGAIAILKQANKDDEANLSPIFREILRKRGQL